jgi:DNA-binding CsgD family transcriptional regulator
VGGRGEAAGVRERAPARATERELVVVTAVLEAGSEKAAAHRLGLSRSTVKHHLANARSKVGAETTAQLVWILAPRLPEPEGASTTDDQPAVRPLGTRLTRGQGVRSARSFDWHDGGSRYADDPLGDQFSANLLGSRQESRSACALVPSERDRVARKGK